MRYCWSGELNPAEPSEDTVSFFKYRIGPKIIIPQGEIYQADIFHHKPF